MIKRKVFEEIRRHVGQKEIALITGPRQAGKTTLMLFLKKELEKEGKKTLYLNMDIENDRRFFASQHELLRKIRLEIGQEGGCVFLDEIQRKENAGLFLKGLYDMGLPYKFVVSGSGSVELKEKIHESLAGRKRVFELSSLSFEEFVHFRTQYRYEQKLQDFFEIEKERTEDLLREYLQFGGYPRVVLAQTEDEKRNIIAEIYQSYLERDILYLLDVQKEEVFTQLVRVLASQIGNVVNISEFSSTLGISAQTVKRYLWYLEKTFIVHRVSPFHTNIRKELTKAPVYYFADTGLRNYAADVFGRTLEPRGAGFLFENFVYLVLRKNTAHTSFRAHFWRTKYGAEVDFVVDAGTKPVPIEVKYSHLKEPRIGASLKSFLSRYNPKLAYVVNLGLRATIQAGNTEVRFIYPFELDKIMVE
jgi:uncharacterized protein